MSDCAGPSLFRCIQRTGVQASNRFYERGALPAVFDQQPVEACATASACLDAYRVYDDSRWLTCGRWAFNWFLGENHLQQWLFDPSTGDCRDGLHIDRVNQNQGTRKGIPRSCEASKARAINLYYGAADTSVALATGSISQLLDWLDRHGTPCNHAIGSYLLGPAILFRGSVCPAVLSLPSFHGFLTMAWPERNPWVLSPRPVPLSSLTLRPRVHVAMESRSAISASTPRVRSSGVNAWTARFSGAFLADGPARTDRSCRATIRERPDGESPGRHECIRVRGHFSASGAPVACRLDVP